MRQSESILFLGLIFFLTSCGPQEQRIRRGQPEGENPSGQQALAVDKAKFTWIQTNLLAAKCLRCHGPGGKAEDISFATYDDLMKSGTIVKGDPAGSSFYQLMDQAEMPPRKPRLDAELIDAAFTWITNGANND